VGVRAGVTLDLSLGPDQQALAEAVRAFCERRCTDEAVRRAAGAFPSEIWRGLAEVGVLALATPEGGGGALDVAAAMEELGRANCPGPLAATFVATQLLPESERAAVGSGEAVVSVGASPVWPWGVHAGVFIEVSADRAWRVRPRGDLARVETLADEPWGRAEADRGDELAPAERALALGDVALASYLAAAGRRLLDLAAGHARDRRQFGRAIGDFQAIAHPLADCFTALTAASTLARIAAFRFDAGHTAVRAAAAAARLSATRAALGAAYSAHQTFGALGYTAEGPVALLAQRVRQASLLPPGPGAARAAVLSAAGAGP
jgi:hypothetical protein